MNEKKKAILSAIGIFILLLTMIGISYAAYNFVISGTKENVITSGQANISFDINTLVLENTYPMEDAVGIASNTTEMNITVSSTITGNATLYYAIGLDQIAEGATLTADYVKIYLLKENTVTSEFEEGIGQPVSNFESKAVTGVLNNYVLHTDTISTGETTHQYKLKAWVSEDYESVIRDGSLGNTHVKVIDGETFSFKIKFIARDIPMTITNN